MQKDSCGVCGSTEWRIWRLTVSEHKDLVSEAVESCDKCAGIKPGQNLFKDAAGNRLTTDPATYGQYNDQIGVRVTSKQQLSEHLKKHNLVQKGSDHVGTKRW